MSQALSISRLRSDPNPWAIQPEPAIQSAHASPIAGVDANRTIASAATDS